MSWSLIIFLGGGIMASGTVSRLHLGERIIIGGLAVQVVFFSVFVVTGVIFHSCLLKDPTLKVKENAFPWQKHLYALYVGSTLILIRNIFRLVEYGQGNDGYLISHKVFLYVFDSNLMLTTMILFAIIHPSEIKALLVGPGGMAVKNVTQIYQMA